MPTLKTTPVLRAALPETLRGTRVKERMDGSIWLDYADDQLDVLTEAASNLISAKLPVGWDARDLVDAIARAKKLALKAAIKAEAVASGELDPDLKITLERLLKRRQNLTVKAILAAFDFLGVEVDKEATLDSWIVRVDGHEAPVQAFPVGKKTVPRNYDLADIGLPFNYEEAAEARAVREIPYVAVRLAIRERIAKALGLDELPEDAEKAKAWRMEHGFEAPPRPKELVHGAWTCAYCWQVHAVNADGRLVHHGYQRPGHGSIVGDCQGVGELPWERSPEGAKWALEGNLAQSGLLVDRLVNGYFRLDVYVMGSTKPVWIFPEDPRWAAAEARVKREDERHLQALWSHWFRAIPWLRAAIRDWKHEEMGAVGAPTPNILPEDFAADRPGQAGEINPRLATRQ